MRPSRSCTSRSDDAWLADGGALEHLAGVVDDGAEPRRRHLEHPAAGLDGTHARRRHLLGLHDRAGERRAVRGVQDEPGTVGHALPRAVGEEDLPGDRHGDAPHPPRDVEARGPLAHECIPVGEGVARQGLEERAERHVLAEGHPVHLVVAVEDPAVVADEHGGVAEGVGSGALDRPDDEGRIEPPGDLAHLGGPRVVDEVAFRVDDVLRPHDEVDGRIDVVAARHVALEDLDHARVGLARALLAAALHERHGRFALGTTVRDRGGDRHGRDDCGGQSQGGAPAPSGGRSQGLAGEDRHRDERQRATDAQHARQRSRHLPHGEVGERHAAEGPRPANELGERPGAGQREPAPAPRRSGGNTRPEHGGVGHARDGVAGRGESGHPHERRHEQRHGDQPPPCEAGTGRLVGDEAIETHDAGEGQRPEAEGRQRQAQAQPARQRQREGAEALGSVGHRAMMAAQPPSSVSPRRPCFQ